MTWQVNWKKWRWPWIDSSVEHMSVFPDEFVYLSWFAGIGPFQFHWYSGL